MVVDSVRGVVDRAPEVSREDVEVISTSQTMISRRLWRTSVTYLVDRTVHSREKASEALKPKLLETFPTISTQTIRKKLK